MELRAAEELEEGFEAHAGRNSEANEDQPLVGTQAERGALVLYRGCKPKPQKIPSPHFQPSNDRIKVDDLPVTTEFVVPIQMDVAPGCRRHLFD